MDRIVKAMIKGQERALNYSVEVMFAMMEKYGSIKTALELMEKNDKEGFEAVRWFAVAMANDGELCRREEGQEPLPMVKEKDVSIRMKPLEYKALREAVTEAIVLGYQREAEDPEEETDLGLAELEAKKEEAGV